MSIGVLVVIREFGGYVRGQVIHNAASIEALLTSEFSRHVVASFHCFESLPHAVEVGIIAAEAVFEDTDTAPTI